MICDNCGADIKYVYVQLFEKDGTDRQYMYILEDLGNGVYGFDADHSWVGDGLDDEDALDTIICPRCKKFPFLHKEIGRNEKVQLTFWSSRFEEESNER